MKPSPRLAPVLFLLFGTIVAAAVMVLLVAGIDRFIGGLFAGAGTQ